VQAYLHQAIGGDAPLGSGLTGILYVEGKS
jgi:hypothetical protein